MSSNAIHSQMAKGIWVFYVLVNGAQQENSFKIHLKKKSPISMIQWSNFNYAWNWIPFNKRHAMHWKVFGDRYVFDDGRFYTIRFFSSCLKAPPSHWRRCHQLKGPFTICKGTFCHSNKKLFGTLCWGGLALVSLP
jgi:hypothetical protein